MSITNHDIDDVTKKAIDSMVISPQQSVEEFIASFDHCEDVMIYSQVLNKVSHSSVKLVQKEDLSIPQSIPEDNLFDDDLESVDIDGHKLSQMSSNFLPPAQMGNFMTEALSDDDEDEPLSSGYQASFATPPVDTPKPANEHSMGVVGDSETQTGRPSNVEYQFSDPGLIEDKEESVSLPGNVCILPATLTPENEDQTSVDSSTGHDSANDSSNEVVSFVIDETFDYDKVVLSKKYSSIRYVINS